MKWLSFSLTSRQQLRRIQSYDTAPILAMQIKSIIPYAVSEYLWSAELIKGSGLLTADTNYGSNCG